MCVINGEVPYSGYKMEITDNDFSVNIIQLLTYVEVDMKCY